jgi:SAM-dependent MidA family methyltransferase
MDNELQQLIIERIQREGPITFAEYMRMALYEPGYGYYVTGPSKVGWEGDYYTSTDISTFFANCMGRQLQHFWQKLGRPVNFIVLEQGAGRGHLAQGIRAWAEQEAPEFNVALDYRAEDIHAGQNAIVGVGIAPPHPGGAINPAPTDPHSTGSLHSSTLHNPQSLSTLSVILSNELIDAFPVHIVETQGKRLYELFVGVQQGHLYELLAEPSTSEVANYLDRYKIPWHSFGDGWRAEINLDVLRWIERVARLIRRGFILTIDYGDKAKSLYTCHRRRGTLACYTHHHMNEHPLMHPGQQDITAHVNFSALIDEGRRHGLRLSTFTTQRLWLEGLGIYEDLQRRRLNDFSEADTERATDRGQVALLRWYNLRQRVLALTDPSGMGNFKVLLQSRLRA